MSRSDRSPYLLWVGASLVDHETMLRRRGVSPAGWRWQANMVRALSRGERAVRVLGHVPEPMWPRGRIREAGAETLMDGLEGAMVPYWNLPAVRGPSVAAGYRRATRRVLDEHGRPAAVLAFNAYPQNVAAARVARAAGVPWIYVVADVPEDRRARERHDAEVRAADGRVFLSWGEYDRADQPAPKLHLDGGIREVAGSCGGGRVEGSPVVLYTGSLGHWGGIDLLLEAFRHVRQEGAELWICGHGGDGRVERAAADDARIRYLGLVPEERLHEVSERAHVFVNPRPSNLRLNQANFPSKVLEYLRYCKPVVSTWTAGLAPSYRGVLTVPEEETPPGLARAIDGVLGWTEARRREHAGRIRDFLEREKSWDAQGLRLLDWLKAEVIDGGSAA